jgi:choline dehydrogenase-like flavoprotein
VPATEGEQPIMDDDFDYIIIGGGSAGATLAAG